MTKKELLEALEGLPDSAPVVLADSEGRSISPQLGSVTYSDSCAWQEDTGRPAIVLWP